MNAKLRQAKTAKTRLTSGAANCWLVVNLGGHVFARISRCKFNEARAIAQVAFPELEGSPVDVIAWGQANKTQRTAGEVAPLFTPDILECHGIAVAAGAPRRPVEYWAGKLQERFGHAAAGGAV